MKLSKIYTDPRLADDGVPCCYMGDFIVTVRRWDPRFILDVHEGAQSERMDKTRSLRGLTEERQQELITLAYAKCVIVTWEGLEDDEGKPVPFSVERAVELLSDPRASDFYNWLRAVSSDLETFQREERDEMGKESPSGSAGTSPSGATPSSSNNDDDTASQTHAMRHVPGSPTAGTGT